MPVKHPLIAWLVEDAAFVRLTGVIGQDGKTAYHKIRGTEHSLRLPFFGKRVRYKGRSHQGGVAGEGIRWSEGIFVGIHRRTNQYLMFDAAHGILEARTIMRFPDELKIDAKLAQAVNITPQRIHDSAARDQAFREQVVPQSSIPHEGDVAQKFKRLYIRQEDIVSFGHAPGCPRCEHSMRYGAGRTNIPHSDFCRQRIAAELRGSEAGRRRLAEHDRSTKQQIAEQIQQQHEIPQMDAPVALGEIVRDGRAEASSSVVPSPCSDLPKRSEPATVTAAGSHLRDRSVPEPEPVAEHYDQEEARRHVPRGEAGDIFSHVPGRLTQLLDDDIMAGIVDDPDSDLRDMVMLYEVEERRAARQRQRQIIDLVAPLGGDARAYGRERARKSRAISAEFYSPPRISSLAKDLPSYGIAPGLALDLTVPDENGEPWDFSRPSMRAKAEMLLDAQAPTLLVGSPMCTVFSTWRFINNKKRERKIV